MTHQELKSQWEAKQDRIQFLIDTEEIGITEEIENLELEIHELMKLDYELHGL